MKHSDIKKLLMEILGKVDYDIQKSYDPETAEEPEYAEERMEDLIKLVEKFLKKHK